MAEKQVELIVKNAILEPYRLHMPDPSLVPRLLVYGEVKMDTVNNKVTVRLASAPLEWE